MSAPLQARFFKAMGSPCEFKMRTDDAHHFEQMAMTVQEEVLRLERKYSRYLDDSVLSRINQAAETCEWIAVDEETRALLAYADVAWKQSDGCFDITSGVLRHLWDFKSKRLPNPADVSSLLERIGWQNVELREDALRFLRSGMELDFGGIVKEYAVDRVVGKISVVSDCSFLISLGGDLAVKNGRDDPRGLPWKIGVTDPSRKHGAIASIDLNEGAVCSSGDYERCFVIDGVRYSHLLDPRTGYPAKGPQSVSIKADTCLVAGTLATIAMLMPSSDAIDWLNGQQLAYVLIDESGQISTSSKSITVADSD